jgi:probable rRNA maturation factor
MMHTLSLSVQYADTTKNWLDILPRPTLRRWVQSALQVDAALTIRFVDEVEGRQLNAEFRGKDYATNVLTFTYDDELDDLPEEVRAAIAVEQGEQIEADIILCGAVLEREATEQGKTIVEHAAHLVVHGVLHAQGFDHIEDEEAEIMEELERQIVMGLGFADPYLESSVD